MARRRRNPFYVLLGVVGVAFTLTAVSSCLTVLRGVRPPLHRQAGFLSAHASGFARVPDRVGVSGRCPCGR